MNAQTLTPTAPAAPPSPHPTRAQALAARDTRPGIPFARLVKVELRKMFDTRSGFWLMMSIVAAAVLATGAVILFADASSIDANTMSSAIGIPMAVLLPVIAILAITSEYSQRSGLTTFTLVPKRGRVIAAKLVTVVAIGVVSMLVALVVGSLGNIIGAAYHGIDPVWNFGLAEFSRIVLASVLGMLLGFTLGLLTRNSPAAVVAYFVYFFVWPTMAGMLAVYQGWWHDLQPWVDGNYAMLGLFDQAPSTGEGWLQLLTASTIFLWVPLALGLRATLKAEVK